MRCFESPHPLLRATLCALVAAGGLAPLAAQTPRRASLGPAIATLREEFSGVSSIRELSDGRVILADSREIRLVLGDFAKNTATRLGTVGDGPGEYRRATTLYALRGDSTMMGLGMQRRWTIVDARQKLSTLQPDGPFAEFFGRGGGVLGTDDAGHLLTAQLVPRTPGRARDSSHLVLMTRSTMKLDTIDRVDVGATPREWTADMEKNGDILAAYPVWDQEALGSDGWLAVVRWTPYRVDWRAPDGKWARGAPIVDRVVPVTQREKDAFADRRKRNASAPIIAPMPGVGYGPPPPGPRFEFSATIPPFIGRQSILLSSHGEVVVPRTPTADEPGPLYDVVNRQGIREYQLALVAGQKIVGFGTGVVYVVTTDVDGIQRVSRHRWPAQPRG